MLKPYDGPSNVDMMNHSPFTIHPVCIYIHNTDSKQLHQAKYLSAEKAIRTTSTFHFITIYIYKVCIADSRIVSHVTERTTENDSK